MHDWPIQLHFQEHDAPSQQDIVKSFPGHQKIDGKHFVFCAGEAGGGGGGGGGFKNIYQRVHKPPELPEPTLMKSWTHEHEPCSTASGLSCFQLAQHPIWGQRSSERICLSEHLSVQTVFLLACAWLSMTYGAPAPISAQNRTKSCKDKPPSCIPCTA